MKKSYDTVQQKWEEADWAVKFKSKPLNSS